MMQKSEFSIVEYQESANAYFHGVDIGVNFFKSFLLINGLLLASYGAIGEIIFKDGSNIVPLVFVCLIGLVTSVLVILYSKHYSMHLNNCLQRCVEIESEYEGQLFNRLHNISHRKEVTWTVVSGIQFFAAIFAILWLGFLGFSIG